jgi:hypothetical protein
MSFIKVIMLGEKTCEKNLAPGSPSCRRLNGLKNESLEDALVRLFIQTCKGKGVGDGS